jgi:Zn-dependent protease with chaperone function
MTSDDTTTATPPSRRRTVLTGISPRAWEHPADRGALAALRELRGFDDVLKSLSGLWNERAWRLEYLGAAIRVDHRQYPRVFRLFADAATTLDVPELPEVYVQYDRSINGSCVGLANPFIVVNSGALELLDDDELRCLLGHEIGHLLSGHAVYRTMAEVMAGWAYNLAWLPVGAMALRGIVVALREWWRKAELSADRAGLLASQDPAAALRLGMKLAGGGDLSEVDTAAFLDQAAEYDRAGDLRESVIKVRMTIGRTHPLPVARAAELRGWVEEGAYQRILGGDYPRRDGGAGPASVADDVRAAADSYREAFARSQDPLVSLLRRLGDGAGDWVGAGASRLRGWVASGGRTNGGIWADATGPGRPDTQAGGPDDQGGEAGTGSASGQGADG